MNPTYDLKCEHDSMTIVLTSMKKVASDIQENRFFDLFRLGQIIEFLKTYIHHSHHDKEELILFPALLETDTPWISDTISMLSNEHAISRGYLAEIESNLHEYLSGHVYALERLASGISKYIILEENHIKIENHALLPLADRIFTKTKRELIYQDFKHIQDQEVGHGKHLEYYILLNKLYTESKFTHVSGILF